MICGKNGLLFIVDGVLINAAIILTTGAFISGFFVHLQAPDFLVGLINTANVWATIFALTSFYIFNRIKKTKRFLILTNVVSRSIICSVIALPHFANRGGLTPYYAATMVIVGNLIWSVYNVGANIWLMASIPREERTPFIYMRFLWLRISFTLTSVVMGFVLDAFGGGLIGFTVVFSVSFILSISDVLVLLKIPYVSGEGKNVNTMTPSLLAAPFKNRTFRNFLIFSALFYMSYYASSAFTSLYLIKYMGFSYKVISIILVLTYTVMIVSTVFWRNFEKRKGIIPAFKISAIILALEQLIYGFLFRGNVIIPFIAAFFGGVGSAGFNVIVFNYRYSVMPEDNITNYETWFMVVHGTGILLGPIVGNLLRPALIPLLKGAAWISEFQAMYFIASAAAIISVFFFVGKRMEKSINVNK